MSYHQRLKKNINLYYISSFFSGLIFIIPIWVAFERRFLSLEQMALIEVVSSSLIIGFELPTGALADLIGRRWTVTIGWIIRVIGEFIQAFSFNAIMLVTGFIIMGFGTVLISGADEALVYDSLKETDQESKFQKVKSKQSLIFQIGIVIATLLGGYFYQVWEGLPYFAYGLAEFVAVICFFKMQEPKIDSEKFSIKSYINQTKQGFLELTKNSYVKMLSVFYFLVGGITWSTTFFYNQIFAKDLGFTEIEMGWLFGIFRLINSIVLFRLVSFSSLVTKKRAFILFPVLLIITYLPGAVATKFIGALILFGATFLATARHTILGQYTNEEFSSKNRATAISSLNMLVNVVYIIILVIGGKIMQNNSPKFIFSMLGVVALVFVLPLGIRLAINHSKETKL